MTTLLILLAGWAVIWAVTCGVYGQQAEELKTRLERIEAKGRALKQRVEETKDLASHAHELTVALRSAKVALRLHHQDAVHTVEYLGRELEKVDAAYDRAKSWNPKAGRTA